MIRTNLSSEIVQTSEQPEAWTVEALDIKAGDVYSATFCGPSARDRAEEYAAEKYTPPEDLDALAKLDDLMGKEQP